MASITDVAKRAGCSATLVSRVLNNQPGVSPERRKRIQEAIKDLGYTPNAHARSLVLKKTNTIGVVVDTLCDPLFFDLIKGLEDEIEKYNYDILFCSGKNDEVRKNSYVEFFMRERTDGIILYGSYLEDVELVKKLQAANFPFVLIELDSGEIETNNVLLDNEAGSELAVEHLIQCGCHRIYHVAGDSIMQASERRLTGYLNAMHAHHEPVENIRIIESGWSEHQGYDTIREFLASGEELPDAFYFSSDQTAYGGIRALQENSISIPDDVMIVGFDDDKPRHHLEHYIPLTTISQPLYKMGESAVKLLMNNIDNKEGQKVKTIFTPGLIVRNSTKPRAW